MQGRDEAKSRLPQFENAPKNSDFHLCLVSNYQSRISVYYKVLRANNESVGDITVTLHNVYVALYITTV